MYDLRRWDLVSNLLDGVPVQPTLEGKVVRPKWWWNLMTLKPLLRLASILFTKLHKRLFCRRGI